MGECANQRDDCDVNSHGHNRNLLRSARVKQEVSVSGLTRDAAVPSVAIVGVAVAVVIGVLAVLVGKRPVSLALVPIMIGEVVAMALASLLWSYLLWELHRRKFSQR